MNKPGVCIAAGGTGSRLSLGYPKAGLIVSGHSLLYWSILNLRYAGFGDISVYVNHDDWIERFRRELSTYANVNLYADKGFDNSFQLFKYYAEQHERQRHLFLYGHSPRSSACYKDFYLSEAKVGVSVVTQTSKQEKILSGGNLFIEPPYMIDTSSVQLDHLKSWKTFFEIHKDSVSPIIAHTVPEFNFENEWRRYQHYLFTQRIAI